MMSSAPLLTNVVVDTGVLMSDASASSQRARNASEDLDTHLTAFLWSLCQGSVRLFVPASVVDEAELRLPRLVADPTSLDVAYGRMRHLYLARAVVVDVVPEHWGADDPRINYVAGRDPSDLPAARLAVALGAHLFAQDKDLTDVDDLGTSDWLPVAFATSADAEYDLAARTSATALNVVIALMELGIGAARRLPRPLRILLGLALLCVAVRAQYQVRAAARRLVSQSSGAITTVGSVAVQVSQWRDSGLDARAEAAVPTATAPVLGAEIARVLAHSCPEEGPLLAVDIARLLVGHAPGRRLVDRVRRELRAYPSTFSEVSRGRFALGRPSGYERHSPSVDESAAYLRRAHSS